MSKGKGGYALIGARLVERGYAALPIMPGTKRPGYLRGGEWVGMPDWHQRFAKRLPTTFEVQLWSATDAGVCVVAGAASGGLCAIDIDTDDPAIVSAIVSVLPPTTVRKTGQKGETLFYRGEAVAESASFNLLRDGKKVRVCDLIGPGRQTVLPPTIHPDTRAPYRWSGAEALEEVAVFELPELGEDVAARIAEALKPFGFDEEPKRDITRPVSGDHDSPHRLLNEAALGNLDAWVPQLGLYRCARTRNGYEAVATWRASSTGRPLDKRKLNLKIMPDGIRDFGMDQGYTALDLVMASGGCDLDTAFSFLARSVGWTQDDPITIDVPVTVPATPAQKAVETIERPATDALLPLTHAKGLVGDLVDWIVATARRPNRVLALGAAVTIVGTLIGRRVASPTRSGTHLYVVALAQTGAGKNHPLTCIARLMKAATKGDHHLGPSEFISMSAAINFLQRKPLSVCPMDEFGAFLKRVNSKRASGYEAAISKILRSAWGSSFEAFPTPEWAGRASAVINAPAISIYGLSTPDEFYEALQGEDVTNGFLNRFLILPSGVRAGDKTPEKPVGAVPEKLQLALHELYNWSGSPLGTARLNDPSLDPDPDVLPWASDAALAVYTDLVRTVETEMDENPALEPFIARTAEMAVRLATICAAGRWARGAAVDADDMAWGRDIALASARMVASDAMSKMVVELTHGRMAVRAIDAITKRGGRISRRDLLRALGHGVRVRDVDDMMKGLTESGRIAAERVIPPAGGTPTIFYNIQN